MSLNTYNQTACEEFVYNTKLDHAIHTKYGNYVALNFDRVYQWSDYRPGTPRLRAVTGIIPCASFYYLKFLLDICPLQIVDIGCGMNFFKNVIPGIHGIDGVGNFADETDFFDSNFAKSRQEFYPAAISIDALHFVSIENFHTRVIEFSNIIATGGRGYISMNASRLLNHTSDDQKQQLFGTIKPQWIQIEEYIDQEIKKLPLDLLVVDNFIHNHPDEFVDGNIRLVFKKT